MSPQNGSVFGRERFSWTNDNAALFMEEHTAPVETFCHVDVSSGGPAAFTSLLVGLKVAGKTS